MTHLSGKLIILALLLSAEFSEAAVPLHGPTLSLLAHHLGMLRPRIACPYSMPGLGASLLRGTSWGRPVAVSETTANVTSLLRLASTGVLESENLVLCAEDYSTGTSGPELLREMLERSANNAVRAAWLVIGSESIPRVMKSPGGIRVNQRVFFYNQDTLVLSEVYTINKVVVHKELAITGNIVKVYHQFALIRNQGCTICRWARL